LALLTLNPFGLMKVGGGAYAGMPTLA
jgi:hypothetical protein